jgi:hypothetical protein
VSACLCQCHFSAVLENYPVGPSKRLKRGFLHNPQVRNNPSFIVASVAFMASSTSATLKEQLAFAAPLGRIGSLNSASLVGRPGMFQACLLERPTTHAGWISR